MNTVRLTQIDGALPNLALMKLSHWHRSNGDQVHLTRHIMPTLWEPEYDIVYGSSIFDFSEDRREMFRQQWPGAIMGGSGTVPQGVKEQTTIEAITGQHDHYDYADYPEFEASIGYTQRGCRMAGPKSPCRAFCIVPEKEGFPTTAQTIPELWRGCRIHGRHCPPGSKKCKMFPKKLHLLDNDFFGGPEWRQRLAEIRDGRFKVCFSQGINMRLMTDEVAAALTTIQYRNTQFDERTLYTAWDLLGDERPFFNGADRLEKVGIPGKHLMAYMLIGCDIRETWELIWQRFKKMVDRGIEPYPMVKDRSRKDLLCFQRWVITGLYRSPKAAWPLYERETKTEASLRGWERVYLHSTPADSADIGIAEDVVPSNTFPHAARP